MRIANTFDKLTISEISPFFEMGFSTKGEGRGNGLYNVKQVVHKYHGDIIARSLDKEGYIAVSYTHLTLPTTF